MDKPTVISADGIFSVMHPKIEEEKCSLLITRLLFTLPLPVERRQLWMNCPGNNFKITIIFKVNLKSENNLLLNK